MRRDSHIRLRFTKQISVKGIVLLTEGMLQQSDIFQKVITQEIENFFSFCSQISLVFFSLIAKVNRINSGLRKLGGMADQPMFKIIKIGFKMKL